MSYGENRLKLKNLNNGITVIIGPNGSGKSASIKSLSKELEKEDELFIKYSTRKDDSLETLGSPFRRTNTETSLLSIQSAFLSEGERINRSFDVYFMETILPALLENKKEKSWLLIDEFDSGLSYDRIYRLLEMLKSIQYLEKTKAGKEFNIVLTANSYELVDCVKTLFENNYIYNIEEDKYITINSYEEFKNLYMKQLNYLKDNDK